MAHFCDELFLGLVLVVFLLESSCCINNEVPANNHGIQPLVIIDDVGEDIQRNKLKAVIPVLSAEWSVQFKFNLHGNHTGHNYWCNILQLKQSGPLYHKYGARTPYVTFDSIEKKILIDSAVNNNWMYRRYIHRQIHFNTEYNVEIHQRYRSGGVYKYSIFLDGEEVHSTDNTQAQQFYDVKVFVSNQDGFPCLGSVSDLKITNYL
ncbi:uncharacterized protein [Clytia hemisphaerica]